MRSPQAEPLNPLNTWDVNGAEPGASQHRYRKLRQHRHLERDAVAGFDAREFPQQRRELVDPDVQVLIGYDPIQLVLFLRHPDKGGLVPVLCQMSVDAVVGCVESAANPPVPERWVGRVQCGVPILVPRKQIGIFSKTFREVLLAEPLQRALFGQICLRDKARAGTYELFLSPVRGYLSLG